MAQAETIISLSEAMRLHSRRAARRHRPADTLPADCRAASIYLKKFAALLVIEEAKTERDPTKKRILEGEATSLWCGGGR